MASFQAKTGWDNLRVIEKKKKKLSFQFIPIRFEIGNSQKIAKNAKI